MGLILVYGPPCAGKSTHVREHAAPGDLILDYDALLGALSGQPRDMGIERALRPCVMAAMNSALKEWRRRGTADCWLIRTMPSASDGLGAELVRLDPGEAVCMARAAEQGRSEAIAGIQAWYEVHGDRAGSST